MMPTAERSVAPLVSVVIPNLNGRRHLERCLPALSASTTLPHEVIVVDNGSTDDSLAWLGCEWPAVRTIDLRRNLGFAEANRRGVAAARGPYVALRNNDTEPTAGWLEALLAPLEANRDAAATCALLELLRWPGIVNARGGAISRLGHGWDRDFGRPLADAGQETGSVATAFPTAAAALFRRDELRADGFDPAFFMYHEDVDWGWRMWLTGRRVLLCPNAVVRHAWGGTSHGARGLRWREVLGGRHAVRTLLKHLEWGNVRRRVPRLLLLWLRQRAPLRLLEIVAWNVVHLPGTLAERWRVQRRRVRSDAELEALGVLSMLPIPPDPPQLPLRPDPLDGLAQLIPVTTLLPAEDSARARLHVGWYPPERADGVAMRWTCGWARCVLRAAPEARGELHVELRQPPGAREPAEVSVAINGVPNRRSVAADGFHTISVPGDADHRGVLDVVIESPARVPFLSGGSWDLRTIGCGVRRLGFIPAGTAPRPASAQVSVVIPTYNRSTALLQTLDALAAQTAPPLEVIVVDDGSTDGTDAAVERWLVRHANGPGVRFVHQSNAGPGAARNRGVALARGDLVLFLGDDTVPAVDLVAEHLRAHREAGEPVAVVGYTEWDRGRMKVTRFLDHVNLNGEQFAYGLFADGDDLPFTCLYTSNLSLRRALLGERPFDPKFTRAAWEDAELGYRLSLQGMRIVYRATARTSHWHPMTMAGFLRRQRVVGEAVETLYRLHPELLGDSRLLPPLPPRWFRLARPTLPLVAPLLSAWDALGLPLPAKAYRVAIITAYYDGRLRGQEAPREP
jgi:GT2 family glycosyltransferase